MEENAWLPVVAGDVFQLSMSNEFMEVDAIFRNGCDFPFDEILRDES